MIAHRLDVFHRRCLRAILGISWRDHVTNEEVMRRAGMTPRYCYNKEKENGWPRSQTAERKTIQLCTGCQKTAEERGGGEAKEDMAKNLQRRPGRDGCQLA